MPDLTTPSLILGLVAVLSYLLGSVPFGILITRAMGLGDLRQIGSGNIGATNVLRTGNKGAALATLLLDAAKGGVAVALAGWLVGPDAAQLAALFAFLGHLFPVWLAFRGGKGVATFRGPCRLRDLGVDCGDHPHLVAVGAGRGRDDHGLAAGLSRRAHAVSGRGADRADLLEALAQSGADQAGNRAEDRAEETGLN